MKRLFQFLCGLTAIALTACVNEKLPQENQFAGEKITVTAYAVGDNTPSTRVAHNNPANDGTITLSWSNDDAFSVIRSGNNTTFNKSTADGAGANDFTGSLPGGDGDYYAVYPTTAVTDHLSVPFDISDQSEGLPYLMYATSQTGNSFHFNHALAYIKVTFPEDLENTTATITITTPSGIYTDGNINLGDNGSISGGSKSSISKTVTFGESTDVWFTIPPMDASNKTLIFDVSVGSNNYTATLTGSNSTDIEAGSYYTAPVSLTAVLPCYLPNGNTFNNTIKSILSSATSIVFVAKSDNTTGTLINSGTNSTPAYAQVEVVESERILYIYTSAPEFVFDANCNRMFSSLTGVKTIDFGGCVNTASVTNMSEMFAGTPISPAFTSLDLSDFNTANVTDMSNMFHTCQNLTSLDVSSFDTRKVTNMNKMFNLCRKLESLDVSNFNTASVTDMSYMFSECEVVNLLNVSNFNTASVTDMNHMFYECLNLTSLDVSGFNTASVTNMSYMFSDCRTVATLDVSKFNTTSVTNMASMFNNCAALTSLDVSKFNTTSVANMASMFNNCAALTSLDVSKFNTASVTDMSSMFSGCKAITSLDVSEFNTANVTTMKNMFYNCNALASVDVSSFNTEKVTNMYQMFYGCKVLQQLNVSNFNTANVTDMNSMFFDCKLLTSLNVGSFDTKNVTTMYGMFYGCSALESITFSTNFNTKDVTTMKLMFKNCGKLVSLDLSSFDTGEVTNMESMFEACNALVSITLGDDFNTAEVTNMSKMFFQAKALTAINLSRFNTAKVTTMKQMFYGAEALTSLDLCNFTFNATYTQMFSFCTALSSVFVKTQEDVDKLINGGCGKQGVVVKVCETHNPAQSS